MGNYDWLLTGRILLLEGYAPPMFPRLDYDPERAADIAEEAGANILRFPSMAYFAYYPTKHYPQHPELAGRDLLKETIDACHRRGIRVIPYVPVGHPFLPWDADIEPYNSWAKLDENGQRMPWWHHGYFKTWFLCLNSPYRQAVRNIVEEIVEGYDVDGVYFDGPYQDQDASGLFCHCPYCKKAWYEKSGRDIPKNNIVREWNDPALRDYLSWVVDDVKGSVMRELNAIIKRKSIPHLFNNCNWLMNRYWGGDRYRDADGFMFEGVHTAQEKLLHVMLGRSTGKAIWSYLGSYMGAEHEHHLEYIPGVADHPAIPLYGQELQNEGYTVVAGNAAPIYYGLNRVYYRPDGLESVKDVFDFVDKHSGQLGESRNSKFIGLWVSGSTRDWWFKEDDRKNGKYKYFYYGGFATLKDLNSQTEPFYVSPRNQPDLSKYKILFLPNAACMSEAEAGAVRRYVAEGGNLIATFMTSLYDEAGNRRDDFALADVFGASIADLRMEIPRDRYIRIAQKHPVTEGFSEGQLIPQDLQALGIRAHDEREALGYTTGLGHDEDVSPAVIARKYGKGKVVYLPGGLEALYRTSRYGEIKRLFGNIVEWMAGDAIPYRIAGAGGLLSNMAEGENFTLLHIVNNNGSIVKASPVREQYVPVFGIGIELLVGDRRIESVRLLKSGAEPPFTVEGGRLKTRIDRIDLYECVAVTYGKGEGAC